MNVPEKGSRHAALDMGCDTCHLTHKTGAAPTVENRFHLTKPAPALCLDCHDAKDANLQKAHRNQPFATANCLECHDPHQSASPKLMTKFLHAPFEAKSCETCHAPMKDGKVVLTQTDVKALCVTCHDDKAKLIETAKVPHPGAMGDCTDCHSPHASRQPGLPKTDSCLLYTSESPRRLFGVAPIKLIRRKFMTPRRLSGMALRLHTILLGISTAAASPERAYRDSEERRHGCLRNRQFTQFSRHAV